MTEINVDQYKAVLTAVRKAIVGKWHEREAIWARQSNVLMETVQLAAERDFTIRAPEVASESVMQVDAALKRIEDEKFGICLECEDPISPKRLAAVPWASYCLQCQESHDRRDAAA